MLKVDHQKTMLFEKGPRVRRHSSGSQPTAGTESFPAYQNITLNAVLKLINFAISDLLGVGCLQHVAD